MVLLAILAVVLFAGSVALVASAALEPRTRRSENLEQIDAYGYSTSEDAAAKPPVQTRKSLDKLAASVGDLIVQKLLRSSEEDVQRELISAGIYGLGARRFLGYRALLTIALPVALVWFFSLLGTSIVVVILFAAVGAFAGWMGPSFVVHRRARMRLREIDAALPGLIDLLVVTLEAGVSFTGALRLASQRLEGPLGEEIRLTIQEQSLGLSVLEALENWLRRCDAPGVRSFVRAMVQGDRLGVSIGSILRNQSVEMRARHRSAIEERAQKAPIKILFPLVFLIFPSLFVMILGPAIFSIATGLGG